jgi:hypothetical protein
VALPDDERWIQGEDLWEDAEQYSDYLDTAAETGGHGKDRLLQIVTDTRVNLGVELGAATLESMSASRKGRHEKS